MEESIKLTSLERKALRASIKDRRILDGWEAEAVEAVYLKLCKVDLIEPNTRPSTDYEKAMSGKDRMPAGSLPWHD
jgi:hypothetical protein